MRCVAAPNTIALFAFLILQDVNEQYSSRYPSLYKPGQLNQLFNKRKFFTCTLQGVYTSFILFFIPYGAFMTAVRDDGAHISDQQAFAVTIATSLVIVVSVQVRQFNNCACLLNPLKYFRNKWQCTGHKGYVKFISV